MKNRGRVILTLWVIFDDSWSFDDKEVDVKSHFPDARTFFLTEVGVCNYMGEVMVSQVWY